MNDERLGIADYTFSEFLGRGNYGRYWKAAPPARLGLRQSFVAVKVLDDTTGAKGYERMANELRIYNAADSEHLVAVYDAGQENGVIYYAADYSIDGSLADNLHRLTKAEKLSAVASTARAAHALHEVGVAHRDIKPSNVMLFGEAAKLTDLGLAQILNPGVTTTGYGPIGSLLHQAPEIVVGAKASRASDVFSLGTSLHFVIAGKSVFPDIEALSWEEGLPYRLDPQTKIDPSLTEAEQAVVERAVRTEPEERLQTAEAFAEAVDELVQEANRG